MAKRTDVQQVDPDVDLHVPAQGGELRAAPVTVLVMISLGGVVGTLARHGLSVAFPHGPGAFAWATFATNVAGCGLIGVLMVCLERLAVHRLVRPFLGVGVLGGFTTFSSYVIEVQQGVALGAAAVAVAYLGATLIAAILAVWVGATLTMLLFRGLARTGWYAPRERG